MNFYQIQPTSYIDKLIDEELYQKAGAFQNYWRLFSRYYLKNKNMDEITDEDIEHFKKRYSLRTLAKVFGIGKDTAGKWRDEFIDVINNFTAHWGLIEMQKNSNKDNYTQNQGRHLLDSKYPESSHKVDTSIDKSNLNETTEKSLKNDDRKNSNRQSVRQQVDTHQTDSRQEVDKYKKNKNIKNKNKKINNIDYTHAEEFFEEVKRILSVQVLLNDLKVDEEFLKRLIIYREEIKAPINRPAGVIGLLKIFEKLKVKGISPLEAFEIMEEREWKTPETLLKRNTSKNKSSTEFSLKELEKFGFKFDNNETIGIELLGGGSNE